jgi:hypothetical protein
MIIRVLPPERVGLWVAATIVALVASSAGAVTGTAATAGLEGVPHYDHVVVLVEENESINSSFGPGSPATYLNGTLRPLGTFDDQYYAVGRVSLDNYIAMTSGQPGIQGSTNTDCLGVSLWFCAQLVSTPSPRNLADQLEEKGLSWAEYADGTSQACVHDGYSASSPLTADSYQGDGGTPTGNGAGADYADRHNPWLYYTDIEGANGHGPRCTAHVLPFTNLAGAISGNSVPAFSFITPDTCHDGHDAPCSGGAPGGVVTLDSWLQGAGNVSALLNYLYSHNGLLIITFDEGANSDTSGCCAGGPLGTRGLGGRVGLLALGPGVAAGKTIHTQYDHPALLRTIEDTFAIPEHLNNAGLSSPMVDLFAASTSTRAGATPLVAAGNGQLPNSATGTTLAGVMAGLVPPAAVILAAFAVLAVLPAAARRGRGRGHVRICNDGLTVPISSDEGPHDE